MNSRTIRAVLLVVGTSLLLALSGLRAQDDQSDRAIAAEAIREASAEFSDAFMRGAVDELAALYLPDAVIVPHGGLSIHGRRGIARYFDLPDERRITHHVMHSTQLRVDGDIARDIGRYEIAGENDGVPFGPVYGNYAIDWRRGSEGAWLIEFDMWNSRPNPSRPDERRVAITFDDVPGTALAGDDCNTSDWMEFTNRLLEAISETGVPALGLVTASRVCDRLRERLLPALLSNWLQAGHELGNHSFSHRDLNSLPTDEYLEDISKATEIVRPLASAVGQQFKYFRYPYLHAGNSVESKSAVQAGLDEMGLVNAPVTIDNQEWIFAAVYARAKAEGNEVVMKQVGEAYIPFMSDVFEFFEAYSVEVLGYEPPQVLLLHANELNADYFVSLVEMLRSRGYSFVSMDETMKDEAYRRTDDYVGPTGYSWIHRWASSAGLPLKIEPREPEWLAELFRSYPGS